MLQLRDMYKGVAVHANADDEHTAALELLLLVMLADGKIGIDEQATIEAIADDYEWNSPTFSFEVAFGESMARVRAARLEPGGIGHLLQSIDDRIASRVLRSELVAACREVADADKQRESTEQEILDLIEERFGHQA